MNRRRRFLAKRKRYVRNRLADLMSAAHLHASEREIFLNLFRWPSEMHTTDQALLVARVVNTWAAQRYLVHHTFDVKNARYA